jgi:hypothetical protein
VVRQRLAKLILGAGAISLGALMVWIKEAPPHDASVPLRPKSEAALPSPGQAPAPAAAPVSLATLAGLPPPEFEVLSDTRAVLRYGKDALRYAQTLTYEDPATGAPLVSAPLKPSRGTRSTSLSAVVEIDGIARPATLTLADSGVVYATLPYSGGVLQGRGRDGEVRLQKAQPFKDRVLRPPKDRPPKPAREPEGTCLNCS